MFSWRRFIRLAAVHWAESGRSHLWFLGIGVVVHLCVWLLLTQGGRHPEQYGLESQLSVYVAGYLVTGTLFAGRHLSLLSRRDSALTYLMRPGSSLEKILLVLLVVAVLYPLAYTVAFQVCNLPGAWLGDAARDRLFEAGGTGNALLWLKDRDYGPLLPFADAELTGWEASVWLAGISLQALVLAGALYFQRMAGLKTLVALFVLLVVAIPLLSIAAGAHPWRLFPGMGLQQPMGTGWQVWLWTVWLGVPTLLWLGNWCLLRERELP